MPITINGSGTITGISAGGLPDGSVTAADIETSLDLTGKTVTLPSGTGGKILQVVNTQYNTATSVTETSQTHVDVPFSVNITPTTSTSLMLVSFSLMGETGSAAWDTMASFSRTISGTRTVVVPTTAFSNRNEGIVTFADSYSGTADNSSTPGGYYVHMFPDVNRPANTNTITYTPTVYANSAATFYLNRTGADIDNISYERGISWITVMEVAA